MRDGQNMLYLLVQAEAVKTSVASNRVMSMSTISTCPYCSRMVAIPQGLQETALVRCPLCGAEYPLNEALDLVPPELIPVATSDEAILLGQTHPTDEVGIIRIVGDDEMQNEADLESSNLDAPPIAPSFLLRYGDAAEEEEIQRQIYDSEDTADASENALDEVFNLIAKHKEQKEKESSNQAEASDILSRPRCKPKNELRFFIGLVFSGIVGLIIAYVAMAWFMGAQFPLPSPPKGLKPVLRFVLPERIWAEKGRKDEG